MSLIPSIYNTVLKYYYSTAKFVNDSLIELRRIVETPIFVNGNNDKGLGATRENRRRIEWVCFTGMNGVSNWETRRRKESVTFQNS